MKISQLLAIHQKYKTSDSLDKNFGDGFLIQNNDLFGKIRRQTQDLGFSFSTEFHAEYLSLPLSQLDKILEKKVIPYFDNVSVLHQIEGLAPQASAWDEVTDNLKRNHIFHESCHALARYQSLKFFKSPLSQSEKILRLLIEESFANTCELLGIIRVEDAAHRIFYEANSYIFMYESRVFLKALVQDFGFEWAFQFLLLSYLHSNFLYSKLEDKNLKNILNLLFNNQSEAEALLRDPKKVKQLKAVSRNAFELNPRFREVTTGFYLKLAGLRISNSELHQLDFMKTLQSQVDFMNLIKSVSKLIS